MEHAKTPPLDDWVLYITNHFTHLVVEAQTASPRYHLARKLSERGQKLLVYCPIGRHVGSPLRDFVINLRPKRIVEGNIIYLFPPVIVSPTSVTTPLALIMGTLFILAYLTATRLKIAAQYSTTMLVASVGAVLRTTKKIPLVANYGDPDFAREFGAARRAFKFCEDLVMTRKRATTVVYVDEVVGSYIRQNFPVKKTLFLPNGGYEAGFQPPSSESPDVVALKRTLGFAGKSVVLYAGQLTSVYRLDLMIKAAPDILSEFPSARFLIIGSGPTLSELQKSIKDAHLEDYFVFTGSVKYEAVTPYLMLADVCVQLLDDWCMGTKVVMYMVHRRAIISGGKWYKQYGKFLKDGENSILIAPDARMFAKETVGILKEAGRRRQLGEAAWETVEPFTWDRHASETLRLLHDAAGQ